jgi:3-hydroxy-9,10-secoandrosta-1,3,5(10)-triene-9,17-dione monooxygenase reductase component
MVATVDPATFRRILGRYPTGVCVITTMLTDGRPTGMVVGSFTSVSLDPPLVAFFSDRKSSSWAKIAQAERFCVNVLAAQQEWLCRAFASKAEGKFENVSYRLSSAGLPVLDGIVAWFDCDLYAVHEAGDHFIVLGQVHSLDIGHDGSPLLFLRGDYGQFAPLTSAKTAQGG